MRISDIQRAGEIRDELNDIQEGKTDMVKMGETLIEHVMYLAYELLQLIEGD